MNQQIYNKDQLKEIHYLSIYNRRKIDKKNHQCGCFHCLRKFDSSMIVDWVDNGKTASCPFCDIDSVLHDNKKFPLTDILLKQMHNHCFSAESA